jgi:hypothetical protein
MECFVLIFYIVINSKQLFELKPAITVGNHKIEYKFQLKKCEDEVEAA